MKLLLDTNILVRFLFEPRKLSRSAVRRIESAKAVYVSTILIFEISIKASKRKLNIDPEKLDAGLIKAG